MEAFFSAKRLAKLGIFSALATVLYFLNFSLPLFPSFLQLNLSDLPALIGSFALGPFSGFIIVLVKVLIKLPFTDTVCVGELADLIIGAAFVVPAGLYYKAHKTKKGALLSMLIGAAASVGAGIIANRFILVPFYVAVMHFSVADLARICSAVIPFINENNFYPCYLGLAVLPFNLLRCFISVFATYFVYKRISDLLRKM